MAIAASIATSAVIAAGPSAQNASDASQLFGPRFHSVAVLHEGKPHPLFTDEVIRVRFSHHEDGYDSISYNVARGCNFSGAKLSFAGNRLVLSEPSGTNAGCLNADNRRNGWLASLLFSKPTFSFSATGTLTLASGHRVLKMKRRR